MAVLVTGAAGFIGANIVKALNERGITDIIAVDNLTNAAKFHNLVVVRLATTLTSVIFCRVCMPANSTARLTPSCIRVPVPTPWSMTATT